MKTVFVQTNSIMALGIAASLMAIKQPCIFWNPQTKSFFDMVDELKPDVIVVTQEHLANDSQLALAMKNFDEAKKIVCLETAIKTQWSQISLDCADVLCDWTLIEPAANVAQFSHGKRVEGYDSDVFYFSDQPASPVIMKVLANCANKYKLKIVGPHSLPLIQFLGQADLSTVCDFMVSTKVAIDYRDRHIMDYRFNDILSIPAESLDAIELDKCINSSQYRTKRMKLHQSVKDKTYFHNIAKIFPELSTIALEKIKSINNE